MLSESPTIQELSAFVLPNDVREDLFGDGLWEGLCSRAITRPKNKHGTIQDGDFSGRIPNCAGTSSQGSSEVGLRISGSIGAANFSVLFVHENREAFLFKMMVIRQSRAGIASP